jgi:hypothetical protein
VLLGTRNALTAGAAAAPPVLLEVVAVVVMLLSPPERTTPVIRDSGGDATVVLLVCVANESLQYELGSGGTRGRPESGEVNVNKGWE